MLLEVFFMKKFVKGFIIGTVFVVLGATAVFAAGTGTGIGTGTEAGSGTSLGTSVSSVPENVSTCPWCQKEGHCFQDLDNDGVCDYYNSYTEENFTGHHRQESAHHGFQNRHHNSGQNCSSGYHGFCR